MIFSGLLFAISFNRKNLKRNRCVNNLEKEKCQLVIGEKLP